MKRLIAIVLLFATCTCLGGCNRRLMLRSKMTTAPTDPTTAPVVVTTVPLKVEEIEPGKASIRGCTVEIYHVFYTYVDSGGKKNACSVMVRMRNNSGKAVSLSSLCTVRVKQSGNICATAKGPKEMEDYMTQPDEKVESGRWETYDFYFLIPSFNKPVQVQLLYQGSVLTEITYQG